MIRERGSLPSFVKKVAWLSSMKRRRSPQKRSTENRVFSSSSEVKSKTGSSDRHSHFFNKLMNSEKKVKFREMG